MVLSKPIASSKRFKKYVQKASDFGVAVGGVITLEDRTAYEVLSTIDLQGNRLVLGEFTTIYGNNADSCILKSTGLSSSTALITATEGIKLYDLGFEGNLVFDLNGDNSTGLDWINLNFTNCEIGTIANYTNFVGNVVGFFDCYGLVFDGSIDTIAFTDTLFSVASGETMLTIPNTTTINRRVRVLNSAFIVPSTATGMNINEGSFGNNESFILENVNFAGSGTYITGIDETSNVSVFRNCVGITNSANIGNYYMEGNATATTISVIGTYVKVAGATTAGDFVAKFDVSTTSNRAVYNGPTSGFYEVDLTASLTGANNAEYGMRIYKNGSPVSVAGKATTNAGGRAENLSTQVVTTLSNTDYIEVYIAGLDGTSNPTVENMNVLIKRLN